MSKKTAPASRPQPRTEPRVERDPVTARPLKQKKAGGTTRQQIQEMNNPAPTAKTGGAFKVEATQMGYYDHVRRREGDVFSVNPTDFTETWMRRVDPRTPEHITSAPEALKKAHDEILAGQATRKGSDDVLGD